MTPAPTLWHTGLPSAGKSTLARAVWQALTDSGWRAELLDADEVRRTLWPELGFSRAHRDENVRRMGELARRMTRQGVIAVVAIISPYREQREAARRTLEPFHEIYLSCPLAECERRDKKGLYRAARRGEIRGVTGIDDPYEVPEAPQLKLETDRLTVAACVERVVTLVS